MELLISEIEVLIGTKMKKYHEEKELLMTIPGVKEQGAINLFNTVNSTGFQACGEEGSGSDFSRNETSLYEAGTKP